MKVLDNFDALRSMRPCDDGFLPSDNGEYWIYGGRGEWVKVGAVVGRGFGVAFAGLYI